MSVNEEVFDANIKFFFNVGRVDLFYLGTSLISRQVRRPSVSTRLFFPFSYT